MASSFLSHQSLMNKRQISFIWLQIVLADSVDSIFRRRNNQIIMAQDSTFLKFNIRECEVKLDRLSAEGTWIKNLIKIEFVIFIYILLEYRAAWENTMLRRYNIGECSVNIAKLTTQGSNYRMLWDCKSLHINNCYFQTFLELEQCMQHEIQDRQEKKLILHQHSVRSHVLWLPTKQMVL